MAEVDLAQQQVRLQVQPGFDQYLRLQTAIEAGGGAIRMFHARYLVPQAFFVALGGQEIQGETLSRLRRQLQAVPGVRTAFVDPDRWAVDDQGLKVGGGLLFADPNPHLEDELVQSAQTVGFVLELRPDDQAMMANKEASETDHAVAGLCMLLLAGLGVLLLALPEPPSVLKYGTVAILLGEFVFLFFRTGAPYWPLGPVNWWEGFHDRATAQHRLGIGLLIPIALGDFLRVRRGWKMSPLLSGWGVLMVGLVGGGMLLIHGHTTIDPAHVSMVRRMNAEHVAMGVCVLFFSLSKFVWDVWRVPQRWGRYLHLVFLALLGVALTLYVE